MTRNKTSGIISEEEEQKALAIFLDMKNLVWCHVPNGGQRNKIVAYKLKLQGVKAGVPDVLIFTPPKKVECRGVAIELKRTKGGVVSKSQKEWMEKLTECGWVVEVCNGSGQAIDFLLSIGY